MTVMMTVLVLIFLIAPAQAEVSPLFSQASVLDIELKGPISTIVRDSSDRSEHPFLISAAGAVQEIKVKLRGNSRIELCKFPPLRLNFPPSTAAGSVFAGQDKLKLVTHCSSGARSTSNVLREYAVYRIFNLVSDFSFRVRLARVTYRDTSPRRRVDGLNEPQHAILIESSEELARRIGGSPANVNGVTRQSLDAKQAAFVYVFQYLIGNVDWSLVTAANDNSCCHNIAVFTADSPRLIVPFDFDLSRLVNARYSRSNSGARPRPMPYRKYVGYCTSRESLVEALHTIKAKKSEILAIIEGLPELKPKDIERATEYLDDFFDEAEDENALLDMFERKCL